MKEMDGAVMEMELKNRDVDRDGFITAVRWLENRDAGKSLAEYFQGYGCREIAICGADDLGRLLCSELEGSQVTVRYFIDRNAEGLDGLYSLPVVTLPDVSAQEEVDAVVVTPYWDYNNICRVLAVSAPRLQTFPLKDVVCGL